MIPRVASRFAQTAADPRRATRETLARFNQSGTVVTGRVQLHGVKRAGPIPSPCGGRVQSPSRDLRPLAGQGPMVKHHQGTAGTVAALLRHDTGARGSCAPSRTETVECLSRPSPLPLSPALASRPAKALTWNAARLARASVRQPLLRRAAASPLALPLAVLLASSVTMSRRNSAATRAECAGLRAQTAAGCVPAQTPSPAAPGHRARGRLSHAVTCARLGQ